MSDQEDVFSIDEAIAADNTSYATTDAYGSGKKKKLRLGSLSSKDMIEWLEANDDPAKRRYAGLRILVKSIVDKDGARIPEDQHEAVIKRFEDKDARANGHAVKAVLDLNGFGATARRLEALKNDSGEATTAASPIDSPAT